jgi:hypothetical protein
MEECDFCLSVANTVEEARELLKKKSDDNKNKYNLLREKLYNGSKKDDEEKEHIYKLMWDQSLCYDIDMNIIAQEPDFVYDVTSPIAELFNHSNQ